MSLFEHHKLLFAFFLSLKIFETSFDSSDESFADKLKQLDKLGDESASKKIIQASKAMNNRRVRPSLGLNQVGTKIKRHLAGAVVQLEVMMR
jgi:hypothetical protein